MTVLQTRWNLNQLFFIVSILLVAGAAKGNATMIKAYLILNGIVILIILAGRVLAFSGVVKVGAGGVMSVTPLSKFLKAQSVLEWQSGPNWWHLEHIKKSRVEVESTTSTFKFCKITETHGQK